MLLAPGKLSYRLLFKEGISYVSLILHNTRLKDLSNSHDQVVMTSLPIECPNGLLFKIGTSRYVQDHCCRLSLASTEKIGQVISVKLNLTWCGYPKFDYINIFGIEAVKN